MGLSEGGEDFKLRHSYRVTRDLKVSLGVSLRVSLDPIGLEGSQKG